MNPTVELDMRAFNASVAQLRTVNKRETTDFLRRLAKELLKYLVRLTPPFGYPPNPRTETFGNQLRAGREAVKRDIEKGFQRSNTIELIRNPTGGAGKSMQKLIRSGRLVEAAELARKLGINTAGFIDAVDASKHKRLRNWKGRVTAETAFVAIKSASVNQRIKAAQAHVGLAKAGWMAAARGLRMSFPKWIERHSTPGIWRPRGEGTPTFLITMGNSVKFGNRFTTSIVPQALGYLKGSVEAQYTKLINMRHKRRN